MSNITERLRAAVPDGTLLDEAADEIDRMWRLANDFDGIAHDALNIANELCRTHNDPYDARHRLDEIEARHQEVRERV